MRQTRRTKKRNHAGLLGVIVLVAVFGALAFLIASPPGSHAGAQAARGEDAFFGSIENVPFKGSATGVVRADTNCKPVENGLTNCIAIIDSGGTELHFNYKHMMGHSAEGGQACLASGNDVTITLLTDGRVKVVRG